MAKILLVDDDAAVREFEGEFLRRAGHTVATASNGTEAVRLAHAQSFDAMITDLIMPGKEGFETILEIRQFAPAMKIIATTGGGRMGAADYLHVAQRLGASETLAKPFSGRELTAVVNRVLSARAQKPTAEHES